MVAGAKAKKSKSLSWKLIALLITVMVLATVAGGCSPKEGQKKLGLKADEPEISSIPRETKEKVTLYFSNQDATYLVAEERQVIKGSKSLETLIIEELIRGPKKSGLNKTIPPEARLLSVNVVDGVAFVNFSREFQTKHWGGSTGEIMTLYSVVNSLTRLPGITKVQFLLEGETQDSILGHGITSEPLGPDWSLVETGQSDRSQTNEKITLYFGDQEALFLVAEVREIVRGNKPLATVLIEELIRGPQKPDSTRTVPPESKLLSVKVADGIAYVDFSPSFQSQHGGGTTGERMTLYSIVNSLARLPGIHKVQFLLAGQKQEAILGHADTSRPIAPNWELIKKPETKEKVTLYFGDDQAMYLKPETREVVKDDKRLGIAVIEELVKGPRDSALAITVPKGARLLSFNVMNGTAYVNFSREFQSQHWGGSAGEIMTLYSIINSLAKLPGIERVQFLIEGQKQEAILGHTDTTRPLTPDWTLVK